MPAGFRHVMGRSEPHCKSISQKCQVLDGAGILCRNAGNMGSRQSVMEPASTKGTGRPTDILSRLGKRSLVFVGLMGAGKTAIGRRVAQLLGLQFVDSDHEIEAAARMSIPDLFENYGEAEFRSLERRVISRLLKSGPQVVATGGGAFMNEQTRRAITRNGVSVWLNADLETLLERVSRRQNRPLLQNADPGEVLQKLIDERYPVYTRADVEVMSRDAAREIIADEVIDAIAAHLAKRKFRRGTGI